MQIQYSHVKISKTYVAGVLVLISGGAKCLGGCGRGS